jgi:hypothetical protein
VKITGLLKSGEGRERRCKQAKPLDNRRFTLKPGYVLFRYTVVKHRGETLFTSRVGRYLIYETAVPSGLEICAMVCPDRRPGTICWSARYCDLVAFDGEPVGESL